MVRACIALACLLFTSASLRAAVPELPPYLQSQYKNTVLQLEVPSRLSPAMQKVLTTLIGEAYGRLGIAVEFRPLPPLRGIRGLPQYRHTHL